MWWVYDHNGAVEEDEVWSTQPWRRRWESRACSAQKVWGVETFMLFIHLNGRLQRRQISIGRIFLTVVTVVLFQLNANRQYLIFFALADKVEQDQPACFWKPFICGSKVVFCSWYSQFRRQHQDGLAENL